MNFEEALPLLKKGHTLTRTGWNDPYCIATLEDKDGLTANDFQKVVACRVGPYTHAKLGWHPTNNDILADDWKLVK